MEEQLTTFSSDLQIFQPLNDDYNLISKSETENEELAKSDEDVLLFQQLEDITNNINNSNNDNDLEIVQEVEITTENEQFELCKSNELFHLDNNEKINNYFKSNTDIKCKIDNSHYVKYKLQNGKHIKTWECRICGKEFDHHYTLMRHFPTHTDERKFQCQICGSAFRQMSTLAQHRAIHSQNRPYVCEICEKTFNRVSTLISHRKIHTCKKLHQCHLCNKAFHQKGNLRNHIFTHTNARPYKCEICNKGFNQMSNLMCHKTKAHQKEKAKFICKSYNKLNIAQNHQMPSSSSIITSTTTTLQLNENINLKGILVDTIKTEAMRLAIESNRTPFALLRPLIGIPVLVRVLPSTKENKQMLLPATAQDLKQHAQVSIITKNNDNDNIIDKNHSGCTVQIKIPVVATVIQRNSQSGELCLSVVSPGPNVQHGTENYIIN